MRVALLFVLCVAVGCSKKDSAASEPNPAPTDKAAANTAPAAPEKTAEPERIQAPEEPVIDLVSAGTDPLRKLRWSFKPGQKQTVTIQRELAVTAKAGDGVAPKTHGPTLTFDLELEVKEVAADGTASVEFVVKKAEAQTLDSTKDMTKEAQEHVAVNHVRGMTGRYKVHANGLVTDVKIDEPEDVSHRTHQAIETVRLALYQLTVPVPDAEVGKISQWTVTRGMKHFEIDTVEKVTIGVAEFEGEQITMRMIGLKRGDQQSVTSRGTNAQVFELMALKEQRIIDGKWKLDRLAPESATSNAKNHMQLRNPGISGEVREMETLRETALTITSN